MGKAEGTIENIFVKWANKYGMFTRKVAWINRRGAPDRILAFKGKTLFIEFKSPDGKLSSSQVQEIHTMTNQGIDVRVIDSIEGVMKLLKEVKDAVSIK